MTPQHRSFGGFRGAIATTTIVLAVVCVSTQTKIVAPKNKYPPSEDVKVGLQAAAEARKTLPMMGDEKLRSYIETVGTKLVAAIPPEFQHPEFKHTFELVNEKDINAFALPGGPMFLNRGMIEASKSESEMAGVMAHEISHVALRHGTASQSKSTLPSILGAAGQIGGAILGGPSGSLLNLGSQVGAGAWMTKYSREFESQADIMGAQILARAGYDPREMANMFKTIEAEGGSGGPQWLSDHPNPGNRYAAITKEAESLTIQGSADTGQFAAIRERLKGMGPAYTAEQIAKGQAPKGYGRGGSPINTSTTPRGPVKVDPPATTLQTYTPANFLHVGIPSNWQQVGDTKSSATFAPPGAFFGGNNGQSGFTHGIEFGTAQGSGNLTKDTETLVQSFASNNPQLKQQGSPAPDTVDGRQALTTTLTNVSDISGQPEQIKLTVTRVQNTTMFYIIGVAPQSDAATYNDTFQRVRDSIRISIK
jgi:predicted Zn-dependent protease